MVNQEDHEILKTTSTFRSNNGTAYVKPFRS